MEILIAVVAIGFARFSGILKPGIDDSGNPAAAVSFMNSHGMTGNVLADYAWGEYVIWHGAPGTKVFIDSRYDLAYPPTVVWDWLAFANNLAGASHTLAAYPHDFVLIEKDSAAAKLMDSRPRLAAHLRRRHGPSVRAREFTRRPSRQPGIQGQRRPFVLSVVSSSAPKLLDTGKAPSVW